MGGDRHQLSAAARRARPRADHAVADPGAVRPARGAGARRALPGFLREVRPSRTGSTSGVLRGAGEAAVAARARALGGRVRRRGRPAGGAGGGLLVRSARTRAGPRRDACRAAAAGHRRRDRAPGADGIASHRRRFGAWAAASGCPSAPTRRGSIRCWRRPACGPLRRADRIASGSGDPRHLRPLATEDGPCCGRSTARRSGWCGASAAIRPAGAYRDYHRLTAPPPPRVGATTAAPYDPSAARRRPRAHARGLRRPRCWPAWPTAGSASCALDTELLGHWWYEGVRWLEAVIEEAGRQGLALTTLDDALERHAPPGSGRARRQQLGRGRRPAHLERPAGGRLRLARRARAELARRPGAARASGRCASCWPCRQRLGVPGLPRLGRRVPARAGRHGHARALERGAARRPRGLEPALRKLAPAAGAGAADALPPAESLRRLAHADQRGRHPPDDRVLGHLAGDHGAGADDGVVADRDAAQEQAP